MGYSPRGHKESDTTERLTRTAKLRLRACDFPGSPGRHKKAGVGSQDGSSPLPVCTEIRHIPFLPSDQQIFSTFLLLFRPGS